MKWFDPNGRYNSIYTYSADHVNRARRMVDRNLSIPHRFVLVTDNADGVDKDIKIVPLPVGLMKLGHRWPKLTLFAPNARARFGERILYLDLDLVILSDITPLISDDEFRIMRAVTRRMPYNSSMMLMTADARPQVWSNFKMSNAAALFAENRIASDQFWIFKVLGANEATWSSDDGVIAYQEKVHGTAGLPAHARVVFFPGYIDPSMSEVRERHHWVAEHWR